MTNFIENNDDAAISGLWHLICQTRKGKVSVIRNLDKNTARAIYRSLKPEEHPKEFLVPTEDDGFTGSCSWSAGGRTYGPHDDWLDKVDCISPDASKLDPWDGIEAEVVDIRSQWIMAKNAGRSHDYYGNSTGISIEPKKPWTPKNKTDLIKEWFETSVARYAGASETSVDLYDGFMGSTLKRFAEKHAAAGMNVTKRDMEKYLDGIGIKSRNAMFAKRYDGIRHVVYGNVRSGNYGT